MLHIVSGYVRRSDYMEERDKKAELETRIVEADSEAEAEEKFEKHWTDQDSEYSYHYCVSGMSSHAVIV